MWLSYFWSYLHRTKWAFLSCICTWFKMPWEASHWRLVLCGELVFLIKIWILKNRISDFSEQTKPQNESIKSLLGNSFLPSLSKDRRRPLKIRQLYTMNKALCEFTENLVDKATGDLNIDNVTTYMNQLGSGRKIKSQNERDIKSISYR